MRATLLPTATAALLTLGTTAPAQADETLPVWAIVNTQVGLDAVSPGFRAWFDVQARRSDPSTQLVVRPGLGWAPAPWAVVYAGYAWVPTFYDDPDKATKHEHRAWEQVAFHARPVATVRLTSRTRFEQRFVTGQTDIGVRVRELVRLGWDPKPTAPVGLVVWDDVFVGFNATAWGQPQGFDQNRAFGGLAIALGEHLGRVEVGYMNQVANKGDSLSLLHVLSASLWLSPKTRRPEPAAGTTTAGT